MTTATITRSPGSMELRRLLTLARTETTILLRNKVAVFTAVALPLLMAGALAAAAPDSEALGALLTAALLGTGLIFVVYYTLVTSLVGRREQLVLKRLQASEASPWQILLAPAVPLWGLLLLQAGLGLAAAIVLLGTTVAHLWALPLAVLGGAAAWTALALWSTAWTRTVEAAQLTTLPLILVSLLLSGLSVPLSALPESVERLAHYLPMTAVIDLVNLAMLGVDTGGEQVAGMDAAGTALGMLAPLAAWTAVCLYAGLRNFRWDARS